MGREENNERSLGRDGRTEAKRLSAAHECREREREREMRESEVTNEVTEGGLKEIGRRWRGAKEAIAAAAAERASERRHFHHPISAVADVAEDGGRGRGT